MKKTILYAFMAICSMKASADGGMWFMQLMQEQHLADSLKKAGLKMKVKDLYSADGLSLKDCVGQFGGGCTAEVISPDGLILTNNHCGYSYIHAMSTLEKNYLKDGYFAKSRAEELPVPGLTFTFVLAVEDVTDKVIQRAEADSVDEYTRQSRSFLASVAKGMKTASPYNDKKGVEASIISFYGGNRFYMFYMQTYEDVRLVVNPPLNVAQFGGDGDNWVWPRHNPDFALFRVYADAEGQPAEYSTENMPLHRDRYLPISLKGYKEGDFAMVMGFPGRTSRYLSAAQLKTMMQCQYEPIVKAGEPILKLNREIMAESDSMRLALADDHMSLQNMVKNFGGAVEAVKKVGLVEQKYRTDAALTAYGKKIGNDDYATIVSRINEFNRAYADTLHDAVLYNMTMGSINLDKILAKASKGENYELNRRYIETLLPIWKGNCRLACNRNDTLLQQDFSEIYKNSIFRSNEAIENYIASPDTIALKNDVIYKIFHRGSPEFFKSLGTYSYKNTILSRIYQRGVMDMNGWTTPPDANFTQRLTYGHVKGYSPRDAVTYGYKTTLKGMFEKENPKDPDYEVNPTVRELYEAHNFGPYANAEGIMQTDFLTDNDITGGNSGSPVLNAKGELIGVAFDGNIESLSSDFQYNPRLQRCINADIRYVLWTIETYGGSGYILKELDLRK